MCEKINYDVVTIQDCSENYRFKNKTVFLGDGKVLGFQQEEIPTQTANPSGDE